MIATYFPTFDSYYSPETTALLLDRFGDNGFVLYGECIWMVG